eukprot:scaffold7130_cov65-Phaeocystis_antarctica.AAC.2
MACSSWPMLPIEFSVFGWRSPSVSLRACMYSSYSGLDSSSRPMFISSWPRLLSSTDVPRSAAGSRPSAARA